MLKKIDKLLNQYAPWTYLLLILCAIAFAALVKFDLMDGATGMAINVGLFGLGMSGLLAWRKAREEELFREFDRQNVRSNGKE